MDERERAEHNAAAWLRLEDYELIERSASLGMPGNLHYDHSLQGIERATLRHVKEAREKADAVARELAGTDFVKRWIKANRREGDDQWLSR
jgi:hypothetical protein